MRTPVGASLLAKRPSPDSKIHALTGKTTMTKKTLSHPVKALALVFGLFSSAIFAADAPLKIGTTAAFAIPLEAAVEEASKQGLKVELVEFTDWIAPTSASPLATLM